MEWVVQRQNKLGEKSFSNKNNWGLLCEDTTVFKGQWYGDHHIKYIPDVDTETYTYTTVRVPVIKTWAGDIHIFRIGGVDVMGEVLSENLGVLSVLGMENFTIYTSDIIRVISERRFVIQNTRVDEDKDVLLSYYNSGGYMMTGDLHYSTRYRAHEFAEKDLDYVSQNVYGETLVLPVNQSERSYALRNAKDYHPNTCEPLDID